MDEKNKPKTKNCLLISVVYIGPYSRKWNNFLVHLIPGKKSDKEDKVYMYMYIVQSQTYSRGKFIPLSRHSRTQAIMITFTTDYTTLLTLFYIYSKHKMKTTLM